MDRVGLVLPFVLDHLAVMFYPYKEPVGVYSSSPVFISGLENRIPYCMWLCFPMTPPMTNEIVFPGHIVLLAAQLDRRWEQVCSLLSEGDMLVTLSYGSLGGLGRSWEKIQMPLADIRKTHRWLYRNGWEIEVQTGFWGIGSLIWGWLAHIFTRFRRVDLADRCYFALREYLIDRRKTTKFCWLVVTSSRKASN
jgi:hypothetical protein